VFAQTYEATGSARIAAAAAIAARTPTAGKARLGKAMTTERRNQLLALAGDIDDIPRAPKVGDGRTVDLGKIQLPPEVPNDPGLGKSQPAVLSPDAEFPAGIQAVLDAQVYRVDIPANTMDFELAKSALEQAYPDGTSCEPALREWCRRTGYPVPQRFEINADRLALSSHIAKYGKTEGSRKLLELYDSL
jgi:hypothetical protein